MYDLLMFRLSKEKKRSMIGWVGRCQVLMMDLLVSVFMALKAKHKTYIQLDISVNIYAVVRLVRMLSPIKNN